MSNLDVAAITDLVHRVALYSDKASVEEWGELLAEDVTMELFGPAQQGRAAVMEGSRARRSSGATGPGSGSRHLVTTAVIDVAGDRATGDVSVLFYAKPDAAPRIVNYADEYVRTSSGWKLARRVAPNPKQ